MTDKYEITEWLDLLGDWLDAKGYGEEAGICTKTMDFIHKQSEEIARLREAIFEKETVAEIRAAASRKSYVTVKND